MYNSCESFPQLYRLYIIEVFGMRIPVLECYSWSKFFSVELSFCECSSKNLESQIHVCFIQSSHILEQFSLHISQKIFQSTITRTVIIIPFFFKDRHRFNRSWMEPSDLRSVVLCEINFDWNDTPIIYYYILMPIHMNVQCIFIARDLSQLGMAICTSNLARDRSRRAEF